MCWISGCHMPGRIHVKELIGVYRQISGPKCLVYVYYWLLSWQSHRDVPACLRAYCFINTHKHLVTMRFQVSESPEVLVHYVWCVLISFWKPSQYNNIIIVQMEVTIAGDFSLQPTYIMLHPKEPMFAWSGPQVQYHVVSISLAVISICWLVLISHQGWVIEVPCVASLKALAVHHKQGCICKHNRYITGINSLVYTYVTSFKAFRTFLVNSLHYNHRWLVNNCEAIGLVSRNKNSIFSLSTLSCMFTHITYVNSWSHNWNA